MRIKKKYNRGLCSFRVKVEHIIGDIKKFKILSDRYRNKRKKYCFKVNIIAEIVNFRNEFAFGKKNRGIGKFFLG